MKEYVNETINGAECEFQSNRIVLQNANTAQPSVTIHSSGFYKAPDGSTQPMPGTKDVFAVPFETLEEITKELGVDLPKIMADMKVVSNVLQKGRRKALRDQTPQ